MDFPHFVRLIAIGLQAGTPMHITGYPGVGKTEFTKSLETRFTRAGIKCCAAAADGLGPRCHAARRRGLHGHRLPRRADHCSTDDPGGDTPTYRLDQ
jgi:hypothetical protein